MTILKPITTSQMFKIIPDSYDDIFTITLRSEAEITKQIYELNVDFAVTVDQWYATIDFTDNYSYLKENYTYEMVVKDSQGDIIFLDKVFCTSQNVSTFTNNLNVYTEHTTTNEYILYGE